jgi:hypothetical protein
MSDLDQLLDSLIADVRSQTRAPGASTAINQARRRRKACAAAGPVAVVAVLAAGSALAAGTLGGGEGTTSLAGQPTASPEPSAGQEDPATTERYRTLRKTLTSVPGWAITDGADPSVLTRCGGDWSSEAAGGSFGNISLTSSGDGPSLWAEERGFPSTAQASDAVTRLIGNLASCTAESWRSQPIAQTGAVLASSDAAVIWILQKGASVSTLQMATSDGPPPLAVQAEVADVIFSWMS